MKEATEVKKEMEHEVEDSYKGALFSTIVFVGGCIIALTVILFVFYMTRL